MTSDSPNSFSELYSAYAAGCIDPAFALMLEAQSLMRSDVRRSVAMSEMISGSFLDSAPAARMRDGALERTLAKIDAIEARPEQQRAAGKAAGGAINEILELPEPVRGAAINAVGKQGWQIVSLGLKRLKLDVGSAMEVELYRINAGSKIPRHSHGGTEFTMVLSGGFSDERGSYGPGDVCVKGPSDIHQPVADDDEVCYALAVRDGGLRFTGMLGMVQRLLGGH
ncbi:putative anti-sigma factor, ChR family [Hyphomonas neptunium ATCC 15444]|uniref:ChR family anti-sigma factor n=2 Tax=Hyphomonas TaxID=85 RepID=A0A059FMW2_9PROT|nr:MULTISPECIES: ChrR family anti-sigma-E factor [Hyphomonas]ABI77434.1 putative anti-sigma factor, ChR family [Hyphomonas neptunium ATCC 15444]KCZ92000.1 ChR family anti-sigma factor [Hyphomonas hirschiana VP5]